MDIAEVGDGSSDGDSWDVLNLLILRYANAPIVALQQIIGNNLLRRDLCLWGQHDQVVARTPTLADNLVGLHDGGLCGRAQENQSTRRQQKAAARQRTFAGLSPQQEKYLSPHLLTLSIETRRGVKSSTLHTQRADKVLQTADDCHTYLAEAQQC